MKRLRREERLQLVKFVCALAWADLEVTDAERLFIARVVRGLRLDAEEVGLVEGWLEVPPPPEEVDPARVPPEHRKLFLEAARAIVEADATAGPAERESLRLLQKLLR